MDCDVEAGLRMFAEYRAADQEVTEQTPVVEHFGDSPELADELLACITHGPKRATAGMVAEFAAAGDPLPRIGEHWVACDGRGTPVVVLRSVELRVGPLSSVDERFAWDEGEGDRTLASWLAGHRAYFRRSCDRIGTDFHDEVEVVFERFRVVWPPEFADSVDPTSPG